MITNSFTQFDRTIPPKPGTLPSLTLPNIQRAELANGLKIMIVEHHKLPVVTVQLILQSGSSLDPAGKSGVARFTTSMIDEGTPTKNSLEIADAFDFLGAQFSASANFDGTYLSLTTLKEHLDVAVENYAEVLLHPTFPQKEFDRLQKELLTSLSQQKDRAPVVASNVFNKILYNNHPYGNQVSGDSISVANLSLNDVQQFYNSYYASNNGTLIFVGDITKEEAIKIAEKYLGKWQKKNIPSAKLPESKNPDGVTLYLIDKKDAPQTEIRIGQLGAARNTEDYYTLTVLQHILGSSSGRLFLNLREAKGYTYGAYANFGYRKSTGPFVASAGVKTEVTDSSIIEFLYELNRMRDEVVSDSEFQMYKTAVIQRLPRGFETPSQISEQLANLVLYNLPDNYFNSVVDNLSKVTQNDIQSAAQKYFQTEKLCIVVVGDKEKILSPLEKLGIGKIVLCDTDGNVIK
ncbi:MAG: insulinase family protein [Ignavibacteriales bacterium]|nr:insulinase family protein [Ignavibacteriales bacterium]